MSDTTDTPENKREADHSDRAIDVYHLVPEWSLQGTCSDPLNAGARTVFDDNKSAQIFGNMASFDLRECCILIDFVKLLHDASFVSSNDQLCSTGNKMLDLRCRERSTTMDSFNYNNYTTFDDQVVITFGGQTDEHSTVDTWTHEQGQDVINHLVAIIEHLKYMATDTLNCKAVLTYGSQVNKIDVMGMKENEQKHDIFNKPIAPVDHTKYTKTETFDCKTDIDFDNLNNSVCTDAAAAIAVTYRGTNALNTVKNYPTLPQIVWELSFRRPEY